MDSYRALAKRLETAGHGVRATMVSAHAKFYGVSRQTVYTKLRALAGWSSGRKRRNDAGELQITAEQANAVGAIANESHRQTGKRLLPMQDVGEIAHASGLLSARQSPATLARALRHYGVHPDQVRRPTPHQPMRSLHPNHLWQFDVSTCVLFYLPRKGLQVMDEKVFYKNKLGNVHRIEKERVQRYLCTDHASGAFFLRYFFGAGETAQTHFEFTYEAMSRKAGHLMHGVPMMWLHDPGCANVAYQTDAFFKALNVRMLVHEPGRPRAKGQVESTHNIVERSFEGRLCFETIPSIEELNARADVWQQHYNATRKHSRHGHTRWGMWQQIREEELRLCPSYEVCRDLLHSKPATRHVNGDLTVNFTVKGYEPMLYDVSRVPDVRVHDVLHVTVNPYRAPNVFVIAKRADQADLYVECESLGRDRFGVRVDAPVFGESYSRPIDTPTEHRLAELNELAHGTSDPLEIEKKRAKRAPAFGGTLNTFDYLRDQNAPSFIQRPGTELHMPNAAQVELKPLSHVEALLWLRNGLGRSIESVESGAVREAFPDAIPEDQLPDLLAVLTRGELPTSADSPTSPAERPRLAVVR